MCNQHQCGAPIILILRWPDSEPLATASNLGGETCLVAVTKDILDRGNLPSEGRFRLDKRRRREVDEISRIVEVAAVFRARPLPLCASGRE